jgi:hypothetical protein
VGERNAQAFGRVWEQAERDGPAAEGAAEIAALAAAEPAGTREAVFREVNHGVLQQLGQPVSLHVPLVLYAWHRSLAPDAAGVS